MDLNSEQLRDMIIKNIRYKGSECRKTQWDYFKQNQEAPAFGDDEYFMDIQSHINNHTDLGLKAVQAAGDIKVMQHEICLDKLHLTANTPQWMKYQL
jgi:hypothetical protein